ncbi:MAG: hypothetical protein JKX84_00130, partial [Flavobacteriales bacterium]|nr:hypothetical protein [Flavobacteriales bacterium]
MPEEGGIKYRFEVDAGADISQISLKWEGIESLILNGNGGLLIKSILTLMEDKAPNAQTVSGVEIPIVYTVDGKTVSFNFTNGGIFNEKIIIDPWITNTSFPATNSAYDIQEDAAGNVVVHGNNTNFQVQKYSPAGVLQWTYTTNSVFLGDIAVDNPGNVYIIGGYAAGKRQKLDPAGVQQWMFAGLVEEWRLAFNYSKTVLTVGGYFVNPGGNNLGRLDVNTGNISNQIVYGLE